MLNDLILEMWLASLRWMAAHRMHKKIPNCASSQRRDLQTKNEMWDGTYAP